jgi:hypothetical protein
METQMKKWMTLAALWLWPQFLCAQSGTSLKRRKLGFVGPQKRILLVLFAGLVTSVVLLPHLLFGQSGTLGSTSSPVVNSFGRPMAGVNVSVCQPLATTAAQVTSNVAVLTTVGNPITAGFAAGGTIQVAGFSGSDTYFNGGSFTNGTGITGGYTILSVTSTTIAYSLTHANASASTNGTVLEMGNSTTSCAGLSLVYSDPALTQSLTQPIVTDGLGNWNAFVATGGSQLYYVQFYGPGVVTSLRTMVVSTNGSAVKPQTNDAIQYVSPNGNDGNDGLSMGTAKLTVSAALAAVPIGGTVIVTGGTVAQGSTALTATGRSLICQRGAIITFNGLGSSTDALTIQGWSTVNYPLTVQGCTVITSAGGSASGRDMIQVSGGNHIVLRDLNLFDPGRQAVHVEPGCNNCWIENLTIDNVQTNLCSAAINGCSGTIAASGSLSDDLLFALGDKFSTSLTGIYINEVTVNKGNLRAHARYGEHWYSNNNCTGCAMQTYLFTDTHTDGAGRVPAATPDIYLEKGASGASNSINGIAWVSGDSEDTGMSRTGPVFKASGVSIGQGIFIGSGWTYSNFAALMDVNFPADLNYGVFTQFNQSDVKTAPSAFWKDGTPTAAASVGLMCPGSSTPGSSLVVCSYSGGSWNPGGVAFGLSTKSSNYTLTAADAWVNVTGTTTITVPHALTGQRWVVFNSGSNTVTVQADSGNINGAGSITLSANAGKEITCDGTNCFAH